MMLPRLLHTCSTYYCYCCSPLRQKLSYFDMHRIEVIGKQIAFLSKETEGQPAKVFAAGNNRRGASSPSAEQHCQRSLCSTVNKGRREDDDNGGISVLGDRDDDGAGTMTSNGRSSSPSAAPFAARIELYGRVRRGLITANELLPESMFFLPTATDSTNCSSAPSTGGLLTLVSTKGFRRTPHSYAERFSSVLDLCCSRNPCERQSFTRGHVSSTEKPTCASTDRCEKEGPNARQPPPPRPALQKLKEKNYLRPENLTTIRSYNTPEKNTETEQRVVSLATTGDTLRRRLSSSSHRCILHYAKREHAHALGAYNESSQ